MLAVVVERCREEGIPLERIVVVHCDLEDMEWEGTKELAEEQAKFYGLRFEVVRRTQGNILQHVRDRHAKLIADGKNTVAPFPSSSQRWCTSDHKRDQVKKVMTKLTNETRRGVAPWPSSTARWCTSHHKADQVKKLMTKLSREHNGRRPVRILNCMGMRAAESSARSKLKPFRLDKINTNGKRTTHIWLPIFGMSEAQVWEHIRARKVPHHRAYDLGMTRLSCVL
jgi:3'-phosphoadenosine 5'-phosphosulfate sulfotransferase (PAPS reductase)/FAD synthetase